MAEKKTKEELAEEAAKLKEEKANKAKARREEKAKIKEITAELEKLGCYQPEFDETIEILAKKMVMMDRLWNSLSSKGFIFSSGTAAGNPKGNPEATLFLNLSKSIETHQEKLGLTPSGLLTLKGSAGGTKNEASGYNVSGTLDAIKKAIEDNSSFED